MKYSLVIAFLFISKCILAGEADHYTNRFNKLGNINTEINERSNNYLQNGLEKLNKKSLCDDSIESELELYEVLSEYFANHTKGKLVKDVFYTDEFAKRTIPLKKSIFGKWKILNGYLMGKKSAASSPLALTPMIKIGDQTIGVDKLEHMFGMGLRYFKGHYIKGKSITKVLKVGVFKEKTLLGGNILATGVFSYADLSANFNGMRFWNHMLQKRDDILGQNLGPYVVCEAGKWKANLDKKIDFSKYVDESMDESINCSKFATKSGLRKYKRSLERISEKENTELKCPMSNIALEKMQKKYDVLVPADKKKKTLAHWILNDDGLGKVSYFNEF